MADFFLAQTKYMQPNSDSHVKSLFKVTRFLDVYITADIFQPMLLYYITGKNTVGLINFNKVNYFLSIFFPPNTSR